MSASLSDGEIERYRRHLVLREIGPDGQRRLKDARVLLVGVGGVGCPAALYLAAAGVGCLGLADFDAVSLSNLQRQVLFTTDDLGRSKVEAAADRLEDLNPHLALTLLDRRIEPSNVADTVRGWDLVLDGCDDFPTRLAVSDACISEGVPLVSGALLRWEGMVGAFNGRPCWRCLVPDVPPDAEVCATAGVVGALGGVVGSLAALTAVRILAQAGEPGWGRIQSFDTLAGTLRASTVTADPACPACGGG